MFKLKMKEEEISLLASRYSFQDDDHVIEIGNRAKEIGFYAKEEFLDICEWKSPRNRKRYNKNTEEYIREITKIALSTDTSERLRIESLTLLDGVSWATASVLLHLGHKERYPILDFRALWSLGWEEPPNYTFNFWLNYVNYCRELSEECNVEMRILDRALWQFSKENQSANK